MPTTQHHWIEPQTGATLLEPGDWMGAREVEILDKLGAIHAHDWDEWKRNWCEQTLDGDTREQGLDRRPAPGDEDFPPKNCYRLPGPNLQRVLDVLFAPIKPLGIVKS